MTFQHTKLMMSLSMVATLYSLEASAATINLDFTPGNGITCEGGGQCTIGGGFIDQSYGDVTGQLDAVWNSLLNQAGLDRFVFGGVTQPSQNFGAFSNSGSQSPDAEIFLQPLTGFQVTLNSFTLRTNIGKNPAQAVKVFAADGTTELFSDTLGFVFSQLYSPGLTSTSGLRIRFMGDGAQTVIDDINYTVAAVPLPASIWFFGTALMVWRRLGSSR